MQFKIPGEPEVYTLVESKFTFAEGVVFEKLTGLVFQDMVEGGAPRSMIALQAIFYISIKRLRPTISFAEVGELPIDELEWLPGTEEEQQALEASGGDPAQLVGPTSPAPGSEQPSAGQTDSPTFVVPTSEPSPSSSASVPGSGTSSS